jgi:hypothetical protein
MVGDKLEQIAAVVETRVMGAVKILLHDIPARIVSG